MKTIIPVIVILASILSASIPASAGPYSQLELDTNIGTATYRISGYVGVAESSVTFSTYSILLNGLTGEIQLSTITARSGDYILFNSSIQAVHLVSCPIIATDVNGRMSCGTGDEFILNQNTLQVPSSFYVQLASATALSAGTGTIYGDFDIIGGTVTVPDGDVGIGTATPIQKLDVRGQSYFSDNVGIGSTSPSYALDVTGSYGNIRSTGQAIFATTSGNVGIGTLAPNFKLKVMGDTAIEGSVSNVALFLVESYETTATPPVMIAANVVTGDAAIHFLTAGAPGFVMGVDNTDDKFKINSTNLLTDPSEFTIDTSGNVGIGVEPSVKFQIGAATLAVTASGRVGIGMLSPAEALDVIGNIRVTEDVDGVDISTFQAAVVASTSTNVNGPNQLLRASASGFIENADMDPTTTTMLGPSIDISGAEAVGDLPANRIAAGALGANVRISSIAADTTIDDIDVGDLAAGVKASTETNVNTANNLVQLDVAGKLTALDGSALINLPSDAPTTSTHTLTLSAAGEVYVSSINFYGVGVCYANNGISTMTLIDARASVMSASTVPATNTIFDVVYASGTEISNVLQFDSIFTSLPTIASSKTASNDAYHSSFITPTVKTIYPDWSMCLGITSVPASGILPADFELKMRYWKAWGE